MFNIGDRVVYTKDKELINRLHWEVLGALPTLAGEAGTVIISSNTSVGIRFDNYNPKLHTLDRRVPVGYGYWVDNSLLSYQEIPIVNYEDML